MPSLKVLTEQRADAFDAMVKIRDKFLDSKEPLTDEENAEFDNLRKKVETLDKDITRFSIDLEPESFNRSREQDLEDRFNEARKSHQTGPDAPITQGQYTRALGCWMTGDEEYRGKEKDQELMQRIGLKDSKKAIELRIDRGRNPAGGNFRAPKTLAEVDEQAIARSKDEKRATQVVGTDNLGGYAVPDDMMRQIDRALLAFGGVRQNATVISSAMGGDLPIPTVNDTTNTGELLAEDTETAEQATAFGQVVMKAYKFSSKEIPVSIELMQDSATDLNVLLGDLMGERIGRIENTYFTTGTGSGQPNGIVTASAAGPTTAGATAITWQELVDLEHSVDSAYRAGAGFMMNDSTLGYLKKLADSQNRPLFLPGIAAGEPGSLLGYPYTPNNDMAAIATAAKTVLFGQLSKYLIRDVLAIRIVRLDERYAEFFRVAFLGVARGDGNLINAGTNPVKHLLQA